MSAITSALILLAGFTCTLANLGSPVTIEEFPSTVQVENFVGAFWLQQCVGTVLTNYHILTAANCVDAPTNTRRIRAGSSRRGIDGIVNEVAAVSMHPTYGTLENDGDIAVVRLVSALPLGPTIQQAPILGEGILLPPDLPVTVAGWGTTAEGGLIGNDNLFSLRLYTIEEEECLLKYLISSNPQTITENMICTGLRETSGRDLDPRDAGAALIFESTVVGVVSFGVSRGNDEYPIISAAVGPYSNWIIEVASTL